MQLSGAAGFVDITGGFQEKCDVNQDKKMSLDA